MTLNGRNALLRMILGSANIRFGEYSKGFPKQWAPNDSRVLENGDAHMVKPFFEISDSKAHIIMQ